MEPCPRCGRRSAPDVTACAHCGTPLAFGEEPAPRPLDRELDLDRRGRGRAPDEAAEPAPFDPNRSDWRLGAPADPAPEPAGAPIAWEDGEQGERGEGEGELRPASPARRAAAWAIDGGLVAGAGAALPLALLASSGALRAAGSLQRAVAGNLPIVLPSLAFVAVAAFVYATVAHALAGATLGKRIARIRVVDAGGRPPGIACSASRSAWAVASIALGGAGMLPAVLGSSRRALHDLLAGTRVVEAD